MYAQSTIMNDYWQENIHRNITVVSVRTWVSAVKLYLKSKGKRTFLYSELPSDLKVKRWHLRAVASGQITKAGVVRKPNGKKSGEFTLWRPAK